MASAREMIVDPVVKKETTEKRRPGELSPCLNLRQSPACRCCSDALSLAVLEIRDSKLNDVRLCLDVRFDRLLDNTGRTAGSLSSAPLH